MVLQGGVHCFVASIALTYAKPHAKRRSRKMTDVLIIASVSAEKKGIVLEGHNETGTRAGDWNVDHKVQKLEKLEAAKAGLQGSRRRPHLPSLRGLVG